jgi:hypothetical protein
MRPWLQIPWDEIKGYHNNAWLLADTYNGLRRRCQMVCQSRGSAIDFACQMGWPIGAARTMLRTVRRLLPAPRHEGLAYELEPLFAGEDPVTAAGMTETCAHLLIRRLAVKTLEWIVLAARKAVPSPVDGGGMPVHWPPDELLCLSKFYEIPDQSVAGLLAALRTDPGHDSVSLCILRDLKLKALPASFVKRLEIEYMRAQRRAASAASSDSSYHAERPSESSRRTRTSIAKANAEAMKLAEADPEFVHKSLREWAHALRCAPSLVPSLPFWQAVMERTGRGRKGKDKAPHAVGLTDKLLATTPDPAAEDPQAALDGLIAEQRSDFEPSPLAEDTGKPVRVRTKKKP